MIIEFSRTGGFGGCRISTTVDTTTLPAADATQVEEWVKNLAAGGKTKGKIDRFGYLLKVTKGRKVEQFQFGEGKHPELVSYLLERAMTQPAGQV